MSAPERDVSELLAVLGVPVGRELLHLALTHRSYAYENGNIPTNERLEFLGDAVLGIVVTERLYLDNPAEPEGQLAKWRASVVNAQALADVARTLHVGEFVYLGKGEEATGGRDKSSILADTMEAIIGAMYLSVGMGPTREFLESLIRPMIADSQSRGAGLDWKTSLQEVATSLDLGVPEYRSTFEGPDHERIFTAYAIVGGQELGSGIGRSKKVAEQEAAAAAYAVLMQWQESDSD